MHLLFLIPARGGSKGIPGKNIKRLCGKPLIFYSIEFARHFSRDEDICVSTDDPEIKKCAESIGISVPYIRPAELATDQAGTYDVIQHAIAWYKNLDKKYDAVVLLQPTSPFRLKKHLQEALRLFNNQIDMVVGVIESPYNPYFNLFEENNDGNLSLSKAGNHQSRQEAPPVYALNGLLYIINTEALEKYQSISEFKFIKKYLMASEFNVDLDTPDDWDYAEYLANKRRSLWEM